MTTPASSAVATHPAMLWDAMPDGRVRCLLCAFRCILRPGTRGVCRVRENRDGALVTLVYGRAVGEEIDPIEKKPLFHFLPGTTSYSIATVGCNFRCQFCQNWEISQVVRDAQLIFGRALPPERVVANALDSGCASIAYTYTEPTIFFEYAYDTARLARQAGLRNVFVTNGYETPQAVEAIAPYLDAANVDLKAFSEEYYRRICGARLAPVLDTLRLMVKLGIWVEVTTLLVPGLNDSDEELRALARFLAEELGRDVPWHVSRFFPAYKMAGHAVTPVESIRRALRIGREAGLRYVYGGNLPLDEGEEDTTCPNCHRVVIERAGVWLRANHLRDGRCPDCGAAIRGVWNGAG